MNHLAGACTARVANSGALVVDRLFIELPKSIDHAQVLKLIVLNKSARVRAPTGAKCIT